MMSKMREYTIEEDILTHAREEKTSKRGRNGKKFEVKLYENEKSLHELSGAWNALADVCGSPVYMSPEWVQNWWTHFGRHEKRSLYLVAVWNSDQLIALAPLYRGYSSLGPVVAERRLQIIGSGGSPNEQIGYLDDYGISDFLDFLVDPEYEEEIAEIFVSFLTSADRQVDLITFHQAGDDSFIKKSLYPELKKSGARVRLEHADTCPYIDLTGQETLSKYIKQVKSSARRRFRQTLRATGPGKEYDIQGARSFEDVKEATDTLIALHQERWNALGFPGVFHDRRFTDFFKDIIRISYENGMLWFKQAVDRDGVCASRMILFYNGRYYDYISGFDDNRPSSKYRPGIGLLLNLVNESIEEGIERVELLRGEEGYKYDFTSKNFRNWKLTVVPRQRRPRPVRIASLMIKVQALAYRIAVRELKLLNVQKKKRGVLKMLGGYVSFRWTSLKMKLNS
ncbi:MAG: GNAT family N-acetyltransferase [Balneolaceae bacterium]